MDTGRTMLTVVLCTGCRATAGVAIAMLAMAARKAGEAARKRTKDTDNFLVTVCILTG
jgi:hypothetical protein